MKERIVSGAILAAAAVSLALSASPAQAGHKPHRAPKATAEKHACGGKNGCPAMANEKAADKPAEAKPAEAKPAEPKSAAPK